MGFINANRAKEISNDSLVAKVESFVNSNLEKIEDKIYIAADRGLCEVSYQTQYYPNDCKLSDKILDIVKVLESNGYNVKYEIISSFNYSYKIEFNIGW